MKNLYKYLINGLIVIVPIAITTFVVLQILDITEKIMGRHLPIKFPGLGLIVVLLLLILIGWLSSHWFLQRLINYGERLLDTIPFIKFIYGNVKKVSTAVFEAQNLFKQAVLVPYPHQGAKALGFVMTELSAPLAEKLEEEHVCVFIPFSLTMTAGFNIIVPKRDIIPLDVSSESALQYIITAGAIMPRGNEPTKP